MSHIRDLVGVISREKAEIGAFLSLEPPTSPMRREAASAGFYESPWGKHPRIQLLTIEDLLGGKSIDYPQDTDVTFKKGAAGAIRSIGKAEDSTDGGRAARKMSDLRGVSPTAAFAYAASKLDAAAVLSASHLQDYVPTVQLGVPFWRRRGSYYSFVAGLYELQRPISRRTAE